MEQNLSSSNRGSTNMSAACNTQGMYYSNNESLLLELWITLLSDNNEMLLSYKTHSLLHNPINSFHVQIQ